jgi:hypothetical protein
MQDTMQLLLMEDQQAIQALSSHAPQKAFAARIGAFRMIRRFKHLDATRNCDTSETGSTFALMIADERLRRLSIRGRLSQLLCGPSVGRKSRHTYVDDLPRLQFHDESGRIPAASVSKVCGCTMKSACFQVRIILAQRAPRGTVLSDNNTGPSPKEVSLLAMSKPRQMMLEAVGE